MKRALLLFVLLLCSILAMSQELERIEVEGRIIVKNNDIEGVTVFNTSSNKGTVTNQEGRFKIKVRLNDNIEVSALQFEKFIIKVDEQILESKKLTVYLIERVNKLDEVIILPYGLSGNLIVDLEKVKTFNPDVDAIYFGIGEVTAYQFSADQYTKVDNIFMNTGHLKYGGDVIGIVGLLLKPLFQTKNKTPKSKNEPLEIASQNLSDKYGSEFISNNFNIPEDKVEAFLAFVENNDFDFCLLDEGKEMQLIDHLIVQSKLFLKI